MKAPTRRKVFRIVGESHATRAGRPRQDVLLSIYPGDGIVLEREPDNDFDANAVAIVTGEHDLGYLAKEDAAIVAPALDAGLPYRAQIHRLTGGVGDAEFYGVEVSIAWLGQVLPEPDPMDGRQEEERFNRLDRDGRLDEYPRPGTGKSGGCLGVLAVLTVGSIGTAMVLPWA